MSEATVRARGLKPHRTKTFKLSNDPAFAEKLEDIVGLYLNPPAHALVLSVDEKSQVQALDRTQPGLPLKPGHLATMTHDYKRNGTNAQGIKISLYLAGEQNRRRSLLVVSNLGPTQEAVDIRLDLRKLGIAAPRQTFIWSIDSTTRKSASLLRKNQVTLSIPGYNFRLVGINY